MASRFEYDYPVNTEPISFTWVVPDDYIDLGVSVSTLLVFPKNPNENPPYFETMILGGQWDGAIHVTPNRKDAIETHLFWVMFLANQNGLQEKEEAEVE